MADPTPTQHASSALPVPVRRRAAASVGASYPAPAWAVRGFGGDSGGMGQVLEHFRMARGYAGPGPTRPGRSYSRVAAVYACVRAKAEAITAMPLMISGEDDRLVESGPIAELAERPSAAMSARAFWRASSAFLDLFGRCHWWLMLDAAGRPAEVLPMNPLQMTPRTDRRTGELTGWTYRPAGALRELEQALTLEEVHTIVDPDFEEADRPWEGLSPRQAATLAISQYYKADLANESSLDNGVEPGGILETPHNLQEDQLDYLREQVNQKYQGVLSRRRMMILHGGLEWKPTAAHFDDMEFSDLK